MSRKRIDAALRFARTSPPAMHPFIEKKGPYVTWRFVPGMRYIIPLINGEIAEGTFHYATDYNGMVFFSTFKEAKIPGHPGVLEFSLNHPDTHSDEDMTLQFEEGNTLVEIPLKAPPTSFFNLALWEKRRQHDEDYGNVYVFKRQEGKLPDDVKQEVLSFVPDGNFGNPLRFGGRVRSRKRRTRRKKRRSR